MYAENSCSSNTLLGAIIIIIYYHYVQSDDKPCHVLHVVTTMADCKHDICIILRFSDGS